MGCSCHEPAVFGHLECELAPRGHMTEHAAAAQRAEIRQCELARRMEKAAEVNRTMPHRSQLVNDLLNVRWRRGLK